MRTTSRLVDVPVVVLDKKSQPITDLKPDELEIYDNGRRQNAKFFWPGGAGDVDRSDGEANSGRRQD